MIAAAIAGAFTLAPAAANALAPRPPTAAEQRAGEQRDLINARRVRIAELAAIGDRCSPAIARELARALVFDGRSARSYVEAHEARCGADLELERWANAPIVALK